MKTAFSKGLSGKRVLNDIVDGSACYMPLLLLCWITIIQLANEDNLCRMKARRALWRGSRKRLLRSCTSLS